MSGAAEAVDIPGNVARIRDRIARAALQAGRRPEDVLLVAAAKKMGADRVRLAIASGVADIGENYVQEAAEKQAAVGAGARWHLIGHLQRNKVVLAVPLFDMIQTVDSLRLAEAIGRHALAQGKTMEALLQVNTSGEATKSGVAPQALPALYEQVAAVPGIQVRGLMTIGSLHPDPELGRPEFRLLAGLARELERAGAEMKWLSMGMSHDFEVAIEEGANLVRVGTGVFGPRPA